VFASQKLYDQVVDCFTRKGGDDEEVGVDVGVFTDSGIVVVASGVQTITAGR
jgi:hypothetical protein